MDIETILKLDGAGQNRHEVYLAMKRRAGELFKTLGPEAAVVEYLRSEEGRRAYELQKRAPRPTIAAEPGTSALQKALSGDFGATFQKMTKAAVELVKTDPKRYPTVEIARVEIRRRSPKLVEDEKREAAARRRG